MKLLLLCSILMLSLTAEARKGVKDFFRTGRIFLSDWEDIFP